MAAATGAATTAAASAGSAIINWQNILGFINVILVSADDIALKIQLRFVDFMVNNLILPSNNMQMFMQITIVLAEILIGLALVGGLFTTVSGGVSLMLQSMFLTSTGLYMAQWWMIPASIAVLFGAGQVLSLDYYVIPRLKKGWKKVKLARKWYLYND